MAEIYLAAGCFWGSQKAFDQLNGVTRTTVGYANGTVAHPSYEQVKTSTTGHRETVRVEYDPAVLPLQRILRAFFLCVDPTVQDQQGHDIGSQYQCGIYYADPSSAEIVRTFVQEEAKKYERFFVEVLPLSCFYDAEEYHQKYLVKNPTGYCHIDHNMFEAVRALNQEGENL